MQERRKKNFRSSHFSVSFLEVVGNAQVIVRRERYCNILGPIALYQHILTKKTLLAIKGYFSCENIWDSVYSTDSIKASITEF